ICTKTHPDTHTHTHRIRAHTHILRSEEHTSELQSHLNLVCRLLPEKKKSRHLHLLSHMAARHTLTTHNTHTKHRRRHHDAHPHTPRAHAVALPPTTAFFFNDTATTEIYTLSLHDALPI